MRVTKVMLRNVVFCRVIRRGNVKRSVCSLRGSVAKPRQRAEASIALGSYSSGFAMLPGSHNQPPYVLACLKQAVVISCILILERKSCALANCNWHDRLHTTRPFVSVLLVSLPRVVLLAYLFVIKFTCAF
jgi:hypothetical protein